MRRPDRDRTGHPRLPLRRRDRARHELPGRHRGDGERGSGTNGSQFFIVFGDSALPPNYTVFGTVDAASLKVVETMAAKGHDGSYDDGTGRPNDPFRIVTATAG
ncbi:MAG: peptidylprolyl isomerase [Micropruina sp.]